LALEPTHDLFQPAKTITRLIYKTVIKVKRPYISKRYGFNFLTVFRLTGVVFGWEKDHEQVLI
jgi:hypothetical protein